MRCKLRCIIVALLMGAVLGAYEYPSIQGVQDIQKLYPKGLEEIQTRKQQAKDNFHKDLQAFLKMPLNRQTHRHVLQTWDAMIARAFHAMEVFSLVSLVEPQKDLREACTAASQELKKDLIQTLAETKPLYKMFKNMLKREETKHGLDQTELYYLKHIVKEMELEGYHLSDKERNQVKDLKVELSKISEEFSRNIQEDHSGIWVEEDKLQGLEATFIEQLEKEEKGTYHLTCDYPTYFTAMRSCDDEETRKQLFHAFQNRAYPKNVAVLEEMIAKRDQLAHILGFKSFAHYQLDNEMVKDPTRAQQFLAQLFDSSIQKQKEEIKMVREVLPTLVVPENEKLHPWNILYAQQKLKEIKYDLDVEKIKEYFPLETTIQGLIRIYESFFNLKVETLPISGLWHEDVKLLKINDKDTQKVYGYILLDLFPRPNKYSHACHGTLVVGLDLPAGQETTALSLVIANFPKSTPSTPSLMALNDVKTFFHELGHGIHAMMARTQFAGTAGTNVKIDFVELPSQMLEAWIEEPDILSMISSHYKTQEKMPAEMVAKIQEARKTASGQFVGNQCFLSQFSLECFLSGEHKDTSALLMQLQEKMDLYYIADPQAHFQASFGHLDEYGARYYGYLWSRVFALDVFSQIKQEGLLNPAAGARYVKEILGKGGSEDPYQMLRSYLGREPSQEPFLKAYGIK